MLTVTVDLLENIASQLQKGASKEAITERLKSTGWPVSVIEEAFDVVESRGTTRLENELAEPAPTPLSAVAPTPQENAHRGPHIVLSFLRLGIGLVVLLFIACAWVALRQHSDTPKPATAAVATTVHDSNFSIALPKGWVSEAGNTRGSGVLGYYLPDQAARMTIFVVPAQIGTTYQSHIDDQLKGLKQNGGNVQADPASSVTFGATRGSVVSALIGTSSNPSQAHHYLFAGTAYGKVIYNIDVETSQTVWQNQQTDIWRSVRSFTPLSKDVIKAK